jgi:hypothetical protein
VPGFLAEKEGEGCWSRNFPLTVGPCGKIVTGRGSRTPSITGRANNVAIRYEIPQVSAQKGPTCWYYTMKMILKFHKMTDAGAALEHNWELLHLTRRAITELAAEKKGREKEDIVAKLTEFMQKEVDGQVRADLREARQLVEGMPSTERFVILDAFFENLIQPVNLGNNAFDVHFVERSLAAHGPLYGSIYRLGAGLMDQDFVEDPMEGGKYVYKLDGKAAVGGRHAIVIAGVDGHGNVYYNDPNCPHRFTMVEWEVLKGQLNSPGGSLGDALFGAVNCPNCPHLNQKIAA